MKLSETIRASYLSLQIDIRRLSGVAVLEKGI